MKNGYKYILSIAGICAGVGIVICIIGVICSVVSGVTLFADKTDTGNYTHTYSIGEESINRINIDIKNADVNVIGGCEKSYIEIVNFSENYYSLHVTDRIVEFNEYTDFLSSLKFWENGGGFKGLRYLFRIKKYPDQKTVNVYLENDIILKNLSLTIENGRVNIENMGSNTDYMIRDLESGTVNIKDVSGASSLKMTGCEDCTVNLTDTEFSDVRLSSVLLKFKGSGVVLETGEINISNGSVDLDCEVGSAGARIKAETSGSLTVNGKSYSTNYTNYSGQGDSVPTVGANNQTANNSVALSIDGGNSIVNVNYKISGEKIDEPKK